MLNSGSDVKFQSLQTEESTTTRAIKIAGLLLLLGLTGYAFSKLIKSLSEEIDRR